MEFTLENENNGQIPFLDVMITKTTENQLITSLYHKKD